jgi:hypothetical protein
MMFDWNEDWGWEDSPTGFPSRRCQNIGRRYREAVEAFIRSSSRPNVTFEEFHGVHFIKGE